MGALGTCQVEGCNNVAEYGLTAPGPMAQRFGSMSASITRK